MAAQPAALLPARTFSAQVADAIEHAQRFNRPLALLIANIDRLSEINHQHGSPAGDLLIEQTGQLLRACLRGYDLMARWDGEKFALLLPNTGAEQAQALAEAMRQAAAERCFILAPDLPLRVSMSFGIASYPSDATTQADLDREASTALYQAKLLGRNQVVCVRDVPHALKISHGAAKAPGEQRASCSPPSIPDGPAQHQVARPAVARPLPAEEAAPARALTIQGSAAMAHSAVAPPQRQPGQARLAMFVSTVIAGGLVVALYAWSYSAPPDLPTLGILIALALAAELFQISVYDDNSMSVSLAPLFAAALLAGLPGVVASSAAIALADQLRQRRPVRDLYKVAFNWGTHTIAGIAPVLALAGDPIQLHLEPIVLLALFVAAAGLVYYAVDTLLISAAISLAKRASLAAIWRAQFRWMAVHYLVLSMMGLFLSVAYASLGLLGIFVFLLPVAMIRYAQCQYVARTQSSVRELRRMNHELTQANHEITLANQAIRLLNEELLETLARFFDARDPYSGGHAAKVADYATAIAIELGMSADRQKIIRQAGLLHDIGKIAISEQVLFKTSRLTEAEYEYIKTHTTIGAALLEQSQGLQHLAPFVRHHHERWDGRGYPDRLAGEAIPFEARILNVCDSVEAMASDRPYHIGMPLDQILVEVRRCAGTQFDPVIAEAFIRVAERDGGRLIVNSAYEVMHSRGLKHPSGG